MVRKITIAAAILTLLFVTLYGIAYRNNNKSAEMLSKYDISHSFDLAINWLVQNRDIIMKDHNTALWSMIKNASNISTDKRLNGLFRHYEEKYISRQSLGIWYSYFDENYRPFIGDISLASEYKHYQLFLLYGLTCNSSLSQEPIILSQLSPEYCALHFIKPRCVTHQLMSVQLLAERNCIDASQLNPLISELQNTIVTELTWDFRVGDAYIQRLLMLHKSGAGSAIKPVWLNRFLAAQNDDGGWDDIDPVLPLPMGYAFSLTSTLPKFTQREKSDFHATAQAVWLLALLLQENQPGQL